MTNFSRGNRGDANFLVGQQKKHPFGTLNWSVIVYLEEELIPNLPAFEWWQCSPSHKQEFILTDTAQTSLLFIHTHTQIILVCVKIKVNSSFKGQAHQK